MEQLTKQQVILVAILISFVTSLATGIVTVSLMDQAPQNLARTITQVIQKTVATAVPTGATSTAAVSVAVSDQVADATANVMNSLVRLRDGDSGVVQGLGLIVASSGTIMADKTVVDRLNNPQAVFGSNASMSVSIDRFQMGGDIAFLKPERTLALTLKPIEMSNHPRLGGTVWAMTGTTTYVLSQGIVTELNQNPPMIRTSIPSLEMLPGAPLFDATGAVVGIATNSTSGSATATFYPTALAKDGIPR